MLKYISNRNHYTEIMPRCDKIKHELWIVTVDLKNLYISNSKYAVPFLSITDKLLKREVEISLLHAKKSGDKFQDNSDKYYGLWATLERSFRSSVHFKIVIFDCSVDYIDLRDGIGIKEEGKQNFEAGILTDESLSVDVVAVHLDNV